MHVINSQPSILNVIKEWYNLIHIILFIHMMN